MVELFVGAAVAFAVGLVVTPLLARALRARGLGQPIHDAVSQHAAKAGTPTMGGFVITLALLVAYGAARAVLGGGPTATAGRVVGVVAATSVVGGVDDWLKVRRGRNLGLREVQKSVMLLMVIAAFCALYLTHPGACTRLSVTSCTSLPWDLHPVGWSLMAGGLFWATANAVNFTDGVEGLLSGSAVSTFAALAAIAFWQYRHLSSYRVADPLDLAVVAAALAGGCAGFLWWNAQPRAIFMGDTGSLAIGAGLAGLALSMNIAALVPVIGALYVIEGTSSALQRYTYKLYFKPRRASRRLFRMAPLHHHFELAGWAESTVVVRFWVLSGLAAALGVVIFYGSARGWH
ncbi:MAG TPA: phospho-N-acetylmuramoyl-pentapeptide-transferase [Acidimicrobiales bacterium]|nr:phospho-N-acetylmuramoyl-pentapeptide-transferase [Acidimicrobiales bacterium]